MGEGILNFVFGIIAAFVIFIGFFGLIGFWVFTSLIDFGSDIRKLVFNYEN